MPKLIELTVELEIQKVSCPGVWLCQDGRVSLTVYALGTSYQTCLLPPVFPLMYKDVFYFRKRYQATCALNNICCLMKDETLYCELVQWYDNCGAGDCVILAQYLGALNDVLFPPNMCSNDGVDLLMRRSKEFPGILSPKIEIATKVRIDEVRNSRQGDAPKAGTTCDCGKGLTSARQKAVCHTAPYHRHKCVSSSPHARPHSVSRRTSRSRSAASRSSCSADRERERVNCECPSPEKQFSRSRPKSPEYNVYHVRTNDAAWVSNVCNVSSDDNDDSRSNLEDDHHDHYVPNEHMLKKRIVESRYIDQRESRPKERTHIQIPKVKPCVCEICQRYHELFHS